MQAFYETINKDLELETKNIPRSLSKWFIYFYLFASISIFVYALVVFAMAWNSSDWPAASGEVLSSRIISSGKSGKPEVEYTYAVNGRKYDGSHILIGPGPMGGGIGIASPREYIDKYPKGAQIEVYYDPEDPKRSVLEPGVNRVITLILLTGIFFLILGTFIFRQMSRGGLQVAERSTALEPGGFLGRNGSVDYSHTTNETRLDQAGRWLALLTLLAFLGVIGYAFWPKYHPWLVELGILKPLQSYQEASEKETVLRSRVVEEPYRQEPPVRKQALEQEMEKARKRAEQEAHRRVEQAGAGAEHISLSIAKEFVPIKTDTIGSRWKAFSAPFSGNRPGGIIREPRYQDGNQLYGRMELGTRDNKTYYFVFDLVNGPHPILYFDRNQNGDLADDGGPLRNQGSGRFATVINLPVSQLIKELDTEESFAIWFFLNERSWKKGYANHYSRTQMKGTVSINSKKYLAYIAEWKLNDADFTNDGIYIDLNSNGKIERNTEFIRPGSVTQIEGRKYLFDIKW